MCRSMMACLLVKQRLGCLHLAGKLNSARVLSSITKRRQGSLNLGEYFTKGSSKEIELQRPVPLAGREYLLSSQTEGFPKYLSGPRENCPLFLKAVNGRGATLEHWAKRCREIIDQAHERYLRDRTAVALLFRGLPIKDERDFSIWTNGLGFEPFAYAGIGTLPRNEVEQNVSLGSPEHSDFSKEPHNEMAYSARYPKIFIISSIKGAPWGGETAICDNREILAKLDAGFVEKCDRKGVRYWYYLQNEVSNAYSEMCASWQAHMRTEDPGKVEERLKELRFGFEWEDGNLRCWRDGHVFTTHPMSGERLWFNSVANVGHYTHYHGSLPSFEGIELPANKYPYRSTFSDGEEFEQSLIDEHRRVTWESAVGFQWHDGDVLFVDQLIMQHSRLSFDGERKVAISLLDY